MSRGACGARAGRGGPGGVHSSSPRLPAPVPAPPGPLPAYRAQLGPHGGAAPCSLRRRRNSRAAAPRPRPRLRHPRRRGGAERARAAPPRTPHGEGATGGPRALHVARGSRLHWWVATRACGWTPARGASWAVTPAFSPARLSPERGKAAPPLYGIRNIKSGNHQATPGLNSDGGT